MAVRSGVLMFFFFFQTEMVHVGGRFARLFYDSVDHRFLQGLIAISNVNGLFNFLIAFADPGEICNKIPGACHPAVSEG